MMTPEETKHGFLYSGVSAKNWNAGKHHLRSYCLNGYVRQGDVNKLLSPVIHLNHYPSRDLKVNVPEKVLRCI